MANLPMKSYGRGLLEKYGWTEGKGLGKTENGMVEALKPKLKCDNAGIGHDHAEQFTLNWWEMAFNEAAKRVSVNALKTDSNHSKEDSYCISTKRQWVAKLMKENSLKYGKFIKTETLVKGGDIVPVKGQVVLPEADEASQSTLTSNLSDEELFRICGGRTAHKAARHGHKLVGKLARVIEQEKKQLSCVENCNKKGEAPLPPAAQVTSAAIDEDHARRKKKKKKKKELDSCVVDELRCAANCDNAVFSTPELVVGGVEISSDCQGRRKKRKKKKEGEKSAGDEPHCAANLGYAVSSALESVAVIEEVSTNCPMKRKKRKGKHSTELSGPNSMTSKGPKRKKRHHSE